MELKDAKKLAEKLNVNFVELQYGYQYVFNGYKLTFYPWGKFSRRKWHNNKTNKWLPYKEDDAAIINKYILQSPIADLPPPAFELSAIASRSRLHVQIIEDKGTQACIDHIKRKLAKCEDADNKVKVMLKNLINELPQYL